MVDHDAEPQCGLAANTGFLQLSKSKATTLTYLCVVSYCLTAYGRAKKSKGPHTESCGLGFASITPAELASGLIEPSLDMALPVFAEVIGMKYVIFSKSHGLCIQRWLTIAGVE